MASTDPIKGPMARIAFANGLFKLQTSQSGQKRWTCTLLFPKTADISVLRNLALEAATEAWGDKAAKLIKEGLVHNPFLDGDGPQGKSKQTGEPHKGFPGMTFLRVTSGEDYRPAIVDQQVMPITEPSALRSGYWVNPVVNCFTWENSEKGKGLTFGLQSIQLAKIDEILGGGGGADPDKFFDKIENAGDAPDATKGGDGAAALFD